MGDKRVVSIRLYRYNIGQMKTGNDDKYAVLDYFDTFSISQYKYYLNAAAERRRLILRKIL